MPTRRMTEQEAIEILDHHNRWRTGSGDVDLEMIRPKTLTLAINTVVRIYRERQSKVVEFDHLKKEDNDQHG